MWLLIVVDKCVLLTANFVGFYFVKMSNFVTFFLMKKGVYNPILVLTYWKLKVIITKNNEAWQFLHLPQMTNFAQFRLQRIILLHICFRGKWYSLKKRWNITTVSEVIIRRIVIKFNFKTSSLRSKILFARSWIYYLM